MERAGTDAAGLAAGGGRLAGELIRRFEKAYAELAQKDPHLAAFELQLPDSPPQLIGRGQPRFKLTVNDKAGARALLSLDETRIGASYLNGSIDITGELVAALRLRPLLSDRHPLKDLWSTWLHPRVFGQVKSDRKWIAEHYDEDPEFYTTWLDETRVYSQGVFESDDETLTTALRRKLDFAFDACRMKSGDRVLDIGGGWGAFTEYGGKRGLRVTTLTISRPSEDYINELIEREKLPCTVLLEHFLEHETDEKYDAIVNTGVTEHLPDYRATLAQYQTLLKPGGRVYLDASASHRRLPSTSFVYTYIYPGNASTLCLHDYLSELAKTPLELQCLYNDRTSYVLTSKHWAQNLERARDEIVRRWGEFAYRKFRLFHWGCVYAFSTSLLTAYRMVLELPAELHLKRRIGGGEF